MVLPVGVIVRGSGSTVSRPLLNWYKLLFRNAVSPTALESKGYDGTILYSPTSLLTAAVEENSKDDNPRFWISAGLVTSIPFTVMCTLKEGITSAYFFVSSSAVTTTSFFFCLKKKTILDVPPSTPLGDLVSVCTSMLPKVLFWLLNVLTLALNSLSDTYSVVTSAP